MNSPFPFTQSYWGRSGSRETYPALSADQTFDVAIVGGGFAGLSAALHLKQTAPTVRVAVVEGRRLGFGASGRNGGFLMGFPPMLWMLEDFGDRDRLDDIRFAARLVRDSNQALGALVRDHGIACDWQATQHTLGARNFIETATLRWLAPRLRTIGLESEWLEGRAARSHLAYPVEAAVSFEVVTLDPHQLVCGLGRILAQLGVCIFEQSAVTELTQTALGVRLTTAQGAHLMAEKVIMATNAYSGRLMQTLALDEADLSHTYLLATERLPSEMIERLRQTPVADPTLSFEYYRVHDDRLLYGGIDRHTDNALEEDQHLPSYQMLHRGMIRRFPFLRDVRLEAAWGGAVQQTRTDAPIVRALADRPGVILNLGYGGGSGVGMALLSGRLTTDLALGQPDRDPEAHRLRQLFARSRFNPLALAKTAFGVMARLL